MVWHPLVHEYEWMKMYELAVAYYKEKGNLLVPDAYKTKDGKLLGSWIRHQKNRNKTGKLSDKERELLEQIDIAW